MAENFEESTFTSPLAELQEVVLNFIVSCDSASLTQDADPAVIKEIDKFEGNLFENFSDICRSWPKEKLILLVRGLFTVSPPSTSKGSSRRLAAFRTILTAQCSCHVSSELSPDLMSILRSEIVFLSANGCSSCIDCIQEAFTSQMARDMASLSAILDLMPSLAIQGGDFVRRDCIHKLMSFTDWDTDATVILVHAVSELVTEPCDVEACLPRLKIALLNAENNKFPPLLKEILLLGRCGHAEEVWDVVFSKLDHLSPKDPLLVVCLHFISLVLSSNETICSSLCDIVKTGRMFPFNDGSLKMTCVVRWMVVLMLGHVKRFEPVILKYLEDIMSQSSRFVIVLQDSFSTAMITDSDHSNRIEHILLTISSISPTDIITNLCFRILDKELSVEQMAMAQKRVDNGTSSLSPPDIDRIKSTISQLLSRYRSSSSVVDDVVGLIISACVPSVCWSIAFLLIIYLVSESSRQAIFHDCVMRLYVSSPSYGRCSALVCALISISMSLDDHDDAMMETNLFDALYYESCNDAHWFGYMIKCILTHCTRDLQSKKRLLDRLMILLRKGLFSRVETQKLSSVCALLTLLWFNFHFCSSSSSSTPSSSQSNDGLDFARLIEAHECLNLLQRCLGLQFSVKLLAYDGMSSLLCQFPERGRDIQDIILTHLYQVVNLVPGDGGSSSISLSQTVETSEVIGSGQFSLEINWSKILDESLCQIESVGLMLKIIVETLAVAPANSSTMVNRRSDGAAWFALTFIRCLSRLNLGVDKLANFKEDAVLLAKMHVIREIVEYSMTCYVCLANNSWFGADGADDDCLLVDLMCKRKQIVDICDSNDSQYWDGWMSSSLLVTSGISLLRSQSAPVVVSKRTKKKSKKIDESENQSIIIEDMSILNETKQSEEPKPNYFFNPFVFSVDAVKYFIKKLHTRHDNAASGPAFDYLNDLHFQRSIYTCVLSRLELEYWPSAITFHSKLKLDANRQSSFLLYIGRCRSKDVNCSRLSFPWEMSSLGSNDDDGVTMLLNDCWSLGSYMFSELERHRELSKSARSDDQHSESSLSSTKKGKKTATNTGPQIQVYLSEQSRFINLPSPASLCLACIARIIRASTLSSPIFCSFYNYSLTQVQFPVCFIVSLIIGKIFSSMDPQGIFACASLSLALTASCERDAGSEYNERKAFQTTIAKSNCFMKLITFQLSRCDSNLSTEEEVSLLGEIILSLSTCFSKSLCKYLDQSISGRSLSRSTATSEMIDNILSVLSIVEMCHDHSLSIIAENVSSDGISQKLVSCLLSYALSLYRNSAKSVFMIRLARPSMQRLLNITADVVADDVTQDDVDGNVASQEGSDIGRLKRLVKLFWVKIAESVNSKRLHHNATATVISHHLSGQIGSINDGSEVEPLFKNDITAAASSSSSFARPITSVNPCQIWRDKTKSIITLSSVSVTSPEASSVSLFSFMDRCMVDVDRLLKIQHSLSLNMLVPLYHISEYMCSVVRCQVISPLTHLLSCKLSGTQSDRMLQICTRVFKFLVSYLKIVVKLKHDRLPECVCHLIDQACVSDRDWFGGLREKIYKYLDYMNTTGIPEEEDDDEHDDDDEDDIAEMDDENEEGNNEDDDDDAPVKKKNGVVKSEKNSNKKKRKKATTKKKKTKKVVGGVSKQKLVKQGKLVPELVYQMELLDAELIRYKKLSQDVLNVGRWIRTSTNRDFKFKK